MLFFSHVQFLIIFNHVKKCVKNSSLSHFLVVSKKGQKCPPTVTSITTFFDNISVF